MSRGRAPAVLALLAAAIALGLAGLVPPATALLAMVLVLVVGFVLPRRAARLLADPTRRSVLAFALLAALVGVSALSGADALGGGVFGAPGFAGGLGAAARELALPSSVPVGLLATLTAGSLVAVGLELTDRRGIQSALVLSVSVLGLASVAAPGQRLIVSFALGWPAALLALAQVSSAPGPPDEPVMRRISPSSAPVTRWEVMPVVVALSSAGAVLGVLVLSGVSTLAVRNGGWDGSASGGGGFASRAASDYLGGDMDLSARGTLDDDPLVRVPAASPRLWRAGTLDLYDGRRWQASEPVGGLPQVVMRAPGVLALSPPPAPGPSAAFEVRPLRRGAAQVLAPGPVVTVSSSGLGGAVPGLVAAGDRLLLTGPAPAAYVVRSQPRPDVSTMVPSSSSSASSASSASDPRYLALPAELPRRVRELGRQLAGSAPSRKAAVLAVEAELGRRMSYELNSPVPPPGVDAVDDVLFTSHAGFCEQFASAEVVLLRSAGIPARMAVGFSAAAAADGDWVSLRRSDAHAWVEVWFPGAGWVNSDPTPAATAGHSWWDRAWTSVSTTTRAWFLGALGFLRGHAIGLALVAAVAVAGGLVVVPLVRSGRRGASRSRVDAELAAAYARLEADLATAGRARAPAESLAMLAARLPDDLREPLTVLERALYAPSPPTREEARRAAAMLDGH